MNVDANMPDRMFTAGTTAAETTCFEISDKLNAAMDLLSDAGMLDDKRTRMLIMCETTRAGDSFDRDPEALARKLVGLNAALRNEAE